MKHHYRRMTNPRWWYAHRHQLPRAVHVITGLLVICVSLQAWHICDTRTAREDAYLSLHWQQRIYQSMSDNGKTSIYITTDPDGKRWSAGCMVKETRL